MMLGTGRFGRAPLRTPEELAAILPVPLYLYLSRYVGLVYPSSRRSNPSADVGFQAIRPLPSWVTTNALPLWISGRQWETVVVPLLADPRLYRFRGMINPPNSSPVTLPVTINPPPPLNTGGCGSSAEVNDLDLVAGAVIGQTLSLASVGRLYGCDWTEVARSRGRAKEYLGLLAGITDSYSRGIYLSVNQGPASAMVTLNNFVLFPAGGPRTPGLNNYDNRGTVSQVAAEIVGAINDPLNQFAPFIYAFRPTNSATVACIPLVPPSVLGSAGIQASTSDQSVGVLGAAS